MKKANWENFKQYILEFASDFFINYENIFLRIVDLF